MLYFAFPDGRLKYDCVACGFQCCRYSLGTELTEDEASVILRLKPELRPFLTRGEGKIAEAFPLDLANQAPGCFLLKPDGNCEVEATLGRDLKPWVCRLYPVTDVRRVGRHFVFNFCIIGGRVVCPFTVLSAPGAGIRHEAIEADLGPWSEAHPVWRGAPVCEWLERDADALVRQEGKIRDRLESAAETAGFVELIAAATKATEATTRRRLATLREILEIGDDGETVDRESVRALAVLLPAVRMKYLLTYRAANYAQGRRRAHRVALAMALLALAAARAAQVPISAAMILRLWSRMMNLFHLVALRGEEVRLCSGEEMAAVATPEARALLERLRKHARVKLSVESLREASPLDSLAPFLE